jgi:hypothetical protein
MTQESAESAQNPGATVTLTDLIERMGLDQEGKEMAVSVLTAAGFTGPWTEDETADLIRFWNELDGVVEVMVAEVTVTPADPEAAIRDMLGRLSRTTECYGEHCMKIGRASVTLDMRTYRHEMAEAKNHIRAYGEALGRIEGWLTDLSGTQARGSEGTLLWLTPAGEVAWADDQPTPEHRALYVR